MPNLKDLKGRIESVKSTRKITSAMKMVAAAKLRRAQEAAEAARPYASKMEGILVSLAASLQGVQSAPRLLVGTGQSNSHLLVGFTADRGLCGGFNSSIVRSMRNRVSELESEGKTVKVLFVGRKAHDILKREFGEKVLDVVTGIGKKGANFLEGEAVAKKITQYFDDFEFDVCTIIYNRFKSAMTQIVTEQQLIPFSHSDNNSEDVLEEGKPSAIHVFEPSEEDILNELLPQNIGVQVFQAMLESLASEHGARMAAMDSATRNAGDMIDRLTLTYNRTRQAFITKELIEIISGAEAL